MKEKRKPFLTLGNSKFSKFANSIVLILIIGYAIGKSGLITPTLTTGYEYTISANELNVGTQKELSSKLKGYKINQKELKKRLQAIGMQLEEFQNNVALEMIISTTQNGLEGLVIEFQSNIPREKLKPIFNYVVKDIQVYVKSKKG